MRHSAPEVKHYWISAMKIR